MQRAVFASCNAVSLTGFPSTSMRPIDMAPLGQWTLLVLTCASVVLTLTTAGYAIAKLSRVPWSVTTLFVASTLCTTLVGLIGSALLVGPQMDLFSAVLNATAAFGNSAVHAGDVPGLNDWRAWVVLIPLSVLGSMGVVTITDLYRGHVSVLTRRTLALLSTAYLVTFGLLILLQWLSGSHASAATNSSALAITTRSLGLPIAEVRELPRIVQWVLLPLMLIGGVSGGTAGGLKLNTLVVLGSGVRGALSGKPLKRIVGVAGAWVGVYLLMMVVTVVLLLATESELNVEQAQFLAISALSCVGLSRDPISIAGNGLLVLSAAMLAGRVIGLGILWWSISLAQDDDLPVG
jgi:Trk-type K+ transport system membrane component